VAKVFRPGRINGDLLYIYRDAPTQPLKVIYLDNDGHVIHYDVTAGRPIQIVPEAMKRRNGSQEVYLQLRGPSAHERILRFITILYLPGI
jgi:hypothetical protein